MKKWIWIVAVLCVGHIYAENTTADERLFLYPFVQSAINVGAEESLEKRFVELCKTLQEGGEVQVVAPGSLDVVFTTAESDAHMAKHALEKALAGVEDAKMLEEKMKDYPEVLRASFVKREGKFVLVSHEVQLLRGEPLWRKEGENFFAGYYHSDEDYLTALQMAGLKCVQIQRPCFFGTVKYDIYQNQSSGEEESLGASYIDNHPFTIFSVVKG